MERTNARGRHTYLPQFKSWIVEQAQLPGVSLAGLAMSNQVNANQLRRWVQSAGPCMARVPKAAANLLPVTIAACAATDVEPAPDTAGAAVEIELDGAVVRVRDGVAAGDAAHGAGLRCAASAP